MPHFVTGLFAIALLLIGVSLAMPLAARLRLPPTVLLAALGMGLGLITLWVPGPDPSTLDGGATLSQAPLSDLLDGLTHLGLTAEGFLVLFLPLLLFSAGLDVNVRLLLDEFSAVLLLAVVAVVICTGLSGYALSLVTDQTLIACLLVGAIIAATDPAAVMGVFKDLGAPKRLSVLVQGESLLNDAAAIALFTILLGTLTGQAEVSFLEGSATFLYRFLVGAIFGLAMGRLVAALLSRLGEALLPEVTITIGAAYLTYIIGQRYLDVSGVVAVVTTALTLAAYAPLRLSPEHWNSVKDAWSQLDFWANSLIFVLAAMLAVRGLPEIEATHAIALSALLVAALVARALVVFGLLPGLTLMRLAQPVPRRFQVVILWGGLRGAITLVLALAVSENPAVPVEVRHFISVMAAGFVLFTLFVSAPTLRPLLRLLGFHHLSRVDRALRNRVMALTGMTVLEQVDSLARELGLDPGRGGLPDIVPPPPAASDLDADGTDLTPEERLRVGLLTLISREGELYLSHFNERAVSRPLIAELVAGVESLFDEVKVNGCEAYEARARHFFRLSRGFHFAHWVHRRFGWSGLLARRLADRYEMLLIIQLVMRELDAFCRTSLRPVLGDTTTSVLTTLLARRQAELKSGLGAMELQYPGYAEDLRRQYITGIALRLEEAEYALKNAESVISSEVLDDLSQDLERRRTALRRRPRLDLGLRLTEMVRCVPLFSDLDPQRMVEVTRLLTPRLALPGEVIIRRGEPGHAMYFLASGTIEVRFHDTRLRRETGEFFGEVALIKERTRTADVVAIGYCHLLELRASDFRRLLRRNPALKAIIEETASQRMAELNIE